MLVSALALATVAGGPAVGRAAPAPGGPVVVGIPTVGAEGTVAPVGGRVVRRFVRPTTPYGPGHRGVDLRAQPGEPVRAAKDGTVAFAGPVGGAPWVTVTHSDGLDTTYGGLTPTVRVGERVSIGEVLGHATAAGRIDWGARHRGRYIDPLGLLGGWIARLVPVAADG
ncbi:MAG: M23 family metallopeptidase [Actinobacteria bacterium]|nr:M23 family metallopeptidase [Actinomycetota bacterium]